MDKNCRRRSGSVLRHWREPDSRWRNERLLACIGAKPGPILEQTAEAYAATFETNVLGILLSLKQEMRVMQAQKAGSIINVSLTLGHRRTPRASLYVASKYACRRFNAVSRA